MAGPPLKKKKKAASAKGEEATTKAEKKEPEEQEVEEEAVLEKKKKGKKGAVDATAETAPEADAGKKKKTAKPAAVDPDTLPEPKFYRVAVRGHPRTAKGSALKAFFEEKCGEVTRVQTMEGRHSGLAFVEFSGRKGFNKALKLVDEKFGDSDKILKIRPSRSEAAGKDEADDQPKPKRKRTRPGEKRKKGRDPAGADKKFEVFIGRLPFDKTPAEIIGDIGKKCGRIASWTFPQMKNSKKHKGVAFIKFEDEAGVEKAMALNGTKYGGQELRAEKSVAKKDPKRGGEGSGGRGGGRGGGGDGGRGSGRGRGVKRKAEGGGGGEPDANESDSSGE